MRKLLVAVGLFIGIGSAQAQFCPGVSPWVFDDVQASDPFCPDITWMALKGITLGCFMLSPTDRLYCPDANVTRKQMAAFMSRLGDVVFVDGGNTFGAAAILGTLDNQELQLRVNNLRALRIVPDATSPILIGGFLGNGFFAGASGATVAGGGAPGSSVLGNACGANCRNTVSDAYGTVGGGAANIAGDAGGTATDQLFATVAGGFHNTAASYGSTVAGGVANTASGQIAIVGGGYANTASGEAATIPGGWSNQANGSASFAAGEFAIAQASGEFVWADHLGLNFDPAVHPPGWADASNTFNARATGGIWLVAGVAVDGTPTWGCTLTSGSGWFCSSDRDLKRNFRVLDGKSVLEKLSTMHIYDWQPKDGANLDDHHYGPTAQDFYATFALGHNDKSIGFQDADGVALAAIQGLDAKLEERVAKQQREIAELRARVSATESLRGEVAALRSALAELQRTQASIAAK